MSSARRVLIVTPEAALIHSLRLVLEAEGYETLTARDEVEGLRWVRAALPDLCLVDSGRQGIDGCEFVRMLREITHAPALLLVDHLDAATVVRVLDAGADDCARRDLGTPELLARVRALLRRAEMPPLLPRTTIVIDEGLSVDFSRALVIAQGQPVDLRPTEFRLLYHLVSNPGRVLTYDSLLARVWGEEYRHQTHYVRLYVAYLRQKIEPNPRHPRYILTERGLGYRFVDFRRRLDEGASLTPARGTARA